jgi:ABC-type branched-subunit amino acid transport system ATPase component/ABC-type branched-subunit amino acid transport system permease subunit
VGGLARDEARVAVLGAGGWLAFGVLVFVLYPAPLSILFLGAVLGSLSALVAMGIVLVYRANRIVNFAQGSLGAVAAVLAASLIVPPRSWSFWLAIAVGLLAATALGALVEVAFIRRFARAPRLVLTVATIGIAQLCDALSLYLPRFFDIDDVPQPEPFSFTFEWDPVVFNGGHLLIVVVVPAVVAGMGLFFRRSRAGIAVRAAAESADRAALLGIPVKRLNTLVWVLAAALAGLATVLRLPIQGVPIGSVLGPVLLFRALAAAVIGRMENLPVTFAAAVILGMVQQAVLFESGKPYVADAVLFGVIIVALLVQRGGGLERARLTGASTWAALREVRPIPRELRRLPEVRIGIAVISAAIAAALLLVPLGWPASRVNLFTVGIISAIIICSLLIVTGFAGQISLGHLAIVGFSAAVAGSMAQDGKELFSTILVAGLVGAGVSLVIGLPALRMSGPFFAVTSLGFSVATGTFFLNPEYFPWLVPASNEFFLRPVIFDKFDLESEHAYYYFVLLVFGLTALVVWRIRTSRSGRAIVANRDNSRSAQAFGIGSIRAQLTAFGLSGFIAGIGGALYVFHQRGLSDTLLRTESSMLLLAVAIVGGLGSLPGAMLGAAYLTFINYSTFTASPLSRLFASGVGVLLVLMFLPSGIGGVFYDLRDRLLRVIARTRSLVVPSLLADVRVLDGESHRVHDVELARSVSAPSANPLLLVRDLEVSYGRTQVLFGVDFHVERGEIVALLGTNGAGKSTLLSAVAGLVRPDRGTITFDGTDITGRQPAETVRDGVVFMPGGKGVFPTLTVQENLDLAGWQLAREPEQAAEVTEQVLELFPVLRDRFDQKAGNLSGGEQQMLTLAQAFILRPRLLMIDELSLGLAPVIVEQLLGIVRAIHANGTTVVLVEQSVNVAITLAERAVFLEKGEVRFDGATADLLERPEILRAVFLEGASHAATAPAQDATAAPAPAGREPAHGRTGFEQVCSHCGHEHRVALDVAGLSVRFGGVQAVRDVTFDVRQGQILGIIGPNGAGKTTVLDLVSGFLEPTSGRVALEGTDVTDLTADGRAVLGLGRSFQDARLFPAMTVRQTIGTALERHVEVRDPIAALLLSPAVGASERAVAARVDELIELMRLEAYADKFVGELSTGTRRIVDLACTLAHGPSVLLLDEPSSGIAQRETEALGPVLLDIRDQTGAAMVVIEHDMPLITTISDDLLALELGEVIARGAPGEVIHDPRVVAGYLGGTEAAINRSGRAATAGGHGDRARGDGRGARPRRRPLKAASR